MDKSKNNQEAEMRYRQNISMDMAIAGGKTDNKAMLIPPLS